MKNVRLGGPFQDSAKIKLKRMGFILPDGQINLDIIETVAKMYSGLLFDCLCERCSDMDKVSQVCTGLLRVQSQENPRQAFLAICLQYDAMHQPLPEAMWWIAGNVVMVKHFTHAFVSHLTKCIADEAV